MFDNCHKVKMQTDAHNPLEEGLEPSTLCLRATRSSQLSYSSYYIYVCNLTYFPIKYKFFQLLACNCDFFLS